MPKIYEVRSIARHDGGMHCGGACRDRAEAESLLSERSTGDNQAWADKYHERWWIEEIDTTGLFEIPSAPAPRERFSPRVSPRPARPGSSTPASRDPIGWSTRCGA